MAQLRASNALEPFVLLSKSASSPKGAADLISQAISSPNTYFFAPLLQTPNIQALRNSEEYASHLQLLEIFSWGTYADYKSIPNLPKLSPAQTQKLQLLSLLPLASTQSPLTYSVLLESLSIQDESALESLITTAIASSLIAGTIDPHARQIYIDSIAPLRDLQPGSLPPLVSALEAWSARCADVLAKLEAEENRIRSTAGDRAARQARVDELFEKKLKEPEGEEKAPKGKRTLEEKEGGNIEDDAMDVDGEGGGSRMKGAKRALMGLIK